MTRKLVALVRDLTGRPSGAVGAIIITLMLAAALLGAFLTPYDPTQVDFSSRLASPSWPHPLGTDEWGRDVFSRLLSGAAVTIVIAALTTVTVTVAGSLLGAVSGFVGGWLDRAIIAVMDALLAFPALVMAIAMTTILSGSSFAPVVALSVAYLPYMVRVVRSAVLTIRGRDFVKASRIMGNSPAFTLCRHILPNCAGAVLVMATALFGWSLLAESALSFLGLGLPPPAASWGSMLADSRNYFADGALACRRSGSRNLPLIACINLFGDACRDLLDPTMRPL